MKILYIDSMGLKKIYNLNKFFYKPLISNYYLLNDLIFFLRFKKKNFLSSQKNRSLVNYSKKKIYKQKGTGRARTGSASSPIRIGGGRSFPNKFISKINYKINKKKYNISLKFLMYNFILENKIYIIEDLFMSYPSSSFIIKFIKFLNIKKKHIVFIVNNINKNFFLSCKNIFNIKINFSNKMNLLLLIKFSIILILRSSFIYINK